MDISEVARRSGVPASTLRYYEEKGLICSVGRHGLKRVFDQAVLSRLGFIALAQQTGFSLEDILGLLSSQGEGGLDRQRLRQKAKALEDQIGQLEAMRLSLLHMIDCTAPRHSDCPRFQQLVSEARRPQGRRLQARRGRTGVKAV